MGHKMREFLKVLLDYIAPLIVFLIVLFFMSGIVFDLQGGELLKTAFLFPVPWVSIV